MNCQFLEGKKCFLRPVEESDVTEEYVGWLNDPEITRYLGLGRFPMTLEELRASVERFKSSKSDILLAIIDRETGRHIGNVALNRINWVHRNADTGLVIGAKEFWGKGYATEAWGLLLRYAFGSLNLHKVIATVVAGHDSSQAALEKLGFQVEGRGREEFFLDGKYLDYVRLGMLAGELKLRQGTHDDSRAVPA